MLAVARRRRFTRGEVVFHRDDPADTLHFITNRRLRRRLLELARIYGGDRDGEVAIPLTQAELADMAGTSRATANPILRAEQERETVRLERGRIVVRDRAGPARRTR